MRCGIPAVPLRRRASGFLGQKTLVLALGLGAVLSAARRASADEVVLLLDSSFSMATEDDSETPRSRRAIERAMEDVKFHLAAHDGVTIVLFDSRIHSPVRVRSVEEARLFFRDYTPAGDTNIIDSLARAHKELAGKTRPIIYLYTDGEQTENASLSWQQLVNLYNDYNASVPEENRIRLFYIKWRGCKPNTETDRWLRQIKNINELKAKNSEWGEVERIYFRPAEFQITANNPATPGPFAVANCPFRIEMSEKSRSRGLRFRVEASLPGHPDVGVTVTPAAVEATGLRQDGAFDATLSFATSAGLEPFTPQPVEVRFFVEGFTGDPKNLLLSPEEGLVRGTLQLTEEPTFSVADPSDGELRIDDYELGTPVERELVLSWNRGAAGRSIESIVAFPERVPADLFFVTPAGNEPVRGGKITLGDGGTGHVIVRMNPREFESFDGRIELRGFGHEQVIRVSHSLRTATIALSPDSFDSCLLYDAEKGLRAGASSIKPLHVRLNIPAEAKRLHPTFELGVTVDSRPLAVSPASVGVDDLGPDGSVDLTLRLADDGSFATDSPLPATLRFSLASARGGEKLLTLDPASGQINGTVTFSEKPSFTVTAAGGEARLTVGDVEVGKTVDREIEVRWNRSASGGRIAAGIQGDAGLTAALAVRTGGGTNPLADGGFDLDDSGKARLTLSVTASERKSRGGRIAFTGFGKTSELFFETVPAPGEISIQTADALRSVEVDADSEVTIANAFQLRPSSVNALSTAVVAKIEAPAGVACALFDSAGKEVPTGKPIPVPGVLDVPLTFALKSRATYDAFRGEKPKGRTEARVVFSAAPGSELRFAGGSGPGASFTAPITLALRSPEVTFARSGSALVHVSLNGTDKERAGDGYVVPFDVQVRGVPDAMQRRFHDETVTLSSDGVADVVFRSTGGKTTSLAELVRTPGLIVRPSTAAIALKLDEPLGSVRFEFGSFPVRVTPAELHVTYDRHYLLVYAAAILLLFGGGGAGFFVFRKAAPKLTGCLLVERAAAGTASARRRFDLEEFRTGRIEVGLTERGDVEVGTSLKRSKSVLSLRTKKGRTVLSASASTPQILIDDLPVEKGGSPINDMNLIEFEGYRLRYQTGADDEELIIEDDESVEAAPEAEPAAGADDADLDDAPVDQETMVLEGSDEEEEPQETA